MVAIREINNKGKDSQTTHIFFEEDIIIGIHAVEQGMDVVEVTNTTDMTNVEGIMNLFEEE